MRSKRKATPPVDSLQPTWLTLDEWLRVVDKLHLAPRQAWIISLLLRDYGFTAMATEMGIKEPTVRTYFERIKARNQVTSRMELIIKVFETARPLAAVSA